MKDDIVGTLTISLAGSIHLTRKTSKVKTKESTVDLYHQSSSGRSYKSGSIQYAPYQGNTHSLVAERSDCRKVLPITALTWDYWMTNAPSFSELKAFGKGGRRELATLFGKSADYRKALAHCRDIAVDTPGYIDFELVLVQ